MDEKVCLHYNLEALNVVFTKLDMLDICQVKF